MNENQVEQIASLKARLLLCLLFLLFVLASFAQASTLRENAICAASEDNLLLARSLIKQGDDKALQAMFSKGLITNLNGIEIARVSEVYDDYGIVVIRVVGSLDFYYVAVGNIVKSEAEEEAAELAREARFNQIAKMPSDTTQTQADDQAEQNAQDKAASDEAYRALFAPTPQD